MFLFMDNLHCLLYVSLSNLLLNINSLQQVNVWFEEILYPKSLTVVIVKYLTLRKEFLTF